MPAVAVERVIADRYVVLESLGTGGMGAVYRVRDQRDGRELALKRLNRQVSEKPLTAELFEREFHTLSELAHPRIIEVYDYGIDTDGAFYTMELLGGQDLRALGKVHWRRACELLRDVASSLAIVHSRRLLHGDLSPRNVRCTLDGRAKLLDFGAMAPMGVTKPVVGTAPFIAPEMVQLQALDGRTDLYALGALGYLLLTGRHAYAANNVKQLRDLWRSPPLAPATIEPEVPAALSELVMELLQLNRNARPRTAGAVMERLCAIASLPLDEPADVALAYLTTPSLVGREQQLATVCARVVAAMAGTGSSIVVQATSGGGRTRFLDACVLEAKLLGAHVVRGDLSHAEQGRSGVAGALCRQLFDIAPELAARTARLHAPLLAHVVGSELAGAQPSALPLERGALQLVVRDFVLRIARSLRLVIAVDDADRIDEASAGLLVAVAQKAPRRSLCLIVTADREGEGSAALDLIARAAERIELQPLTMEQTEQLLGSVFGDARHTLTVARGVHALTRGRPRAIMQLAAHLVERGVARYEAGSFVLPNRLLPQDLPSSFAAALVRRMAALDADALELARALVLTDASELPVASYVDLTAHADRARTYRALDQLVRVQLLEPQGDRYRVSDTTWREVLCDELMPPERVALHARLAHVFEHGGSVARRSYHLMESERPEAAIRLLLAPYLKDPNEPPDPLADYVPGMLDLLEQAALAAEALRLPAPLRMETWMKVSGASQFLGDLARFLRVAPPALAQLERDSGLCDYLALDPGVEPMARLKDALARAQRRYETTPESERGLAPAGAIRELARLCLMFCGMNRTAQDTRLLDRLPSLAPFVPLSPTVAVIHKTMEAARAFSQGRDRLGCDLLLQVDARIAEPDAAGLGELYATSMRFSGLLSVALTEATAGLPDAVARVKEHRAHPGYRVNAERVHMVCHLMQGDLDAAAAAQRRAELLMLQDGQVQRYPGMSLRTELYVYWLTGDTTGVRDVVEQTTRMAQHYPGCQVMRDLARCLHRHMQGDHAGALAALEPALAATRPVVHRDWAWVAAMHVQVLVDLGRAAEAADLGEQHIVVCEREELSGHGRVAQATAEALIAAGRPEQAADLTQRLIAQAVEQGVRGIIVGTLYELRARAALACGDAPGFETFAQRCAAEYRLDRNPALAARYERLRREARLTGMAAAPVEPWAGERSASAGSLSTLYTRMNECSGSAERARCVLAILAEQTSAEGAYLYGERNGELSLLQSEPDEPPPHALHGAVQRYLEQEIQQETATAIEDASNVAAQARAARRSGAPGASATATAPESVTLGSALLTHSSGLRIHPLLLSAESQGRRVIAGVAALAVRGDRLSIPSAALLEALALALIDNDDVDPVTCFL